MESNWELVFPYFPLLNGLWGAEIFFREKKMITLIEVSLQRVYGFAITALNSYLGLCAVDSAWSLLCWALCRDSCSDKHLTKRFKFFTRKIPVKLFLLNVTLISWCCSSPVKNRNPITALSVWKLPAVLCYYFSCNTTKRIYKRDSIYWLDSALFSSVKLNNSQLQGQPDWFQWN